MRQACKLKLKTYDYFSGSEISFVLTFLLVGLLPFSKLIVLCHLEIVASLLTSSNNVVICSSCYKVVTQNLLKIVGFQDDSNMLEQLVC